MPSPRIPRIPTLQLSISPGVERQFRALAREAFPNETLAYLLGHDLGHRMDVTELWIPPADLIAANHNTVWIAEHLDWEAFHAARSEGLTLLGDIHTHPWTARQVRLRREQIGISPPMHPSATDWDDRKGLRWITAICLIDETQPKTRRRPGRYRCSFRYWGPLTPVELV